MKLSWATRFTILRILLIVPFVSCMLKINDPSIKSEFGTILRYVAIMIFLFMAFSDALDGYFARIKKQITTLGAFLDPLADKLLMTSACLLLSSQRSRVGNFVLPPMVVVLIIGKDLFLLIGFVTVYMFTSQIRIAPVFIGKLATVLQLSMVGGILIAPEVSRILPGWIWFLRALWWSAAGSAILAILIYIRYGSRYIAEYDQTLVNKTKS
jgi:CDP-diacylglycerol--glycerol-3-phosphate 3-phosphatidyltransferase